MSATLAAKLKSSLLVLACMCLVLALPAAVRAQDEELEITDILLSNYGGNNFVVSWRTNQPTSNNELLFGLTPGTLTNVRADVLEPPSQIHFVQLTSADIDSLNKYYYYRVRSDGLEAANSAVGYDSVKTTQQNLVPLGAALEGYVVDSKTREPLENVMVRSFYRWSRVVSGVTQVDSTMWYTVLTNANGKFNMSMSNYRRYSGSNPPYIAGSTWLHLRILGQSQAEVKDSVLLTFPVNEAGALQALGTYEIRDITTEASNGYLRATGPVLSNGISASVVTVTVLDADNKPLPNVDIRLQASPDRGVTFLQPQLPTDRNGRTWGLVYSEVSEVKTIFALNVSSTDSNDYVMLDSFATVQFIPELNANVALDTVAPFIYFTTEYENTASTTGPYVITSKAVDNFRMKLDLLWTIQSGSYADTIPMNHIPDTDDYTGGIPGHPFNTVISYIVVATDSAGHKASKPDSIHSSAFEVPYVFQVLQDPGKEKPTLGITLTTDALSSTNSVKGVRVDSWILSDRDVSAVSVKWRNTSQSSTFFDLPMDNYGSHYWADIPALPVGSKIEYFVQVTDLDGKTERDRRGAPSLRSPFSYEILSPGSLGTISYADTTSVLGVSATLPSWASALADLNEDGYLDVVVANYGERNSVYFYNPVQGFEDVTNSVLGLQGRENNTFVALADFNADDYLDAVFATEYGQNQLYLNNTAGRLVDVTYQFVDNDGNTYMPADEAGTTCIVPADFDGDGDIDLYIVNSAPGGEKNRLLFNNGKGIFTDVTSTKLFNEPARQSVWGVAGDLDNDGDPDVVVINRAEQHYWMRNKGNGVLEWRALTSNSAANARAADLADVDSDGDLDLVIAQSDFTRNELYMNDGRGEFTRDLTGRLPAESDETYGVRFFDANADGYIDLYYLNFAQPNRLLLNDQRGYFQESSIGLIPTKSANSRHASVGDFNNDNRADIYISEEQWNNTILFSRTFDPNSADLPVPFDLQAPGLSDTVNTSDVTFIWNKSSTSDSTEALKYNLLLSLDSLFSSNSLVASKENLTDTTLTVGPLNDNTRYWWKVFVKGSSGYPVSSIQTRNFLLMTTHQGQGPSFFVLINRNPAFAGHITAYIVASAPLLTNPTVSFNGQAVAAVHVNGNTIYRAHFITRTSFLLTISGKNLSGSTGTFSKTYSATLASSMLASKALTPDRLAWLDMAAAGSSGGEVSLLASTNEPVRDAALRDAMSSFAGMGGSDLGSMAEVRSYTFTVMDGMLGQGARVCIDGQGVDDPGSMAICRLEERGWQPLPTVYDPDSGIFSASADKDGTFALLSFGPGSSQLPRASSFNLGQNSPNPFNPSTFITFTVPGDQPVESFSLKIYNLRGQVVKTLVNGTVSAGNHTVQWDGRADSGRDVPSGVYFYRLNAPGVAMTRKMVLLR